MTLPNAGNLTRDRRIESAAGLRVVLAVEMDELVRLHASARARSCPCASPAAGTASSTDRGPTDTFCTLRSFGVHCVSLKSQQSGGLMAPPISMKMQLPRGAARIRLARGRTFNGHVTRSTHVPAKRQRRPTSGRHGVSAVRSDSLLFHKPSFSD